MEDINDDVDDDDMTDSSKFNKCVSVKRYFNGRMKNIIFRWDTCVNFLELLLLRPLVVFVSEFYMGGSDKHVANQTFIFLHISRFSMFSRNVLSQSKYFLRQSKLFHRDRSSSQYVQWYLRYLKQKNIYQMVFCFRFYISVLLP